MSQQIFKYIQTLDSVLMQDDNFCLEGCIYVIKIRQKNIKL